MMYGRGYAGYAGDYGCFGYGFFNSGWGMLIGIGIIAIIGVVIYLLVNRNKKKMTDYGVLDLLNQKFARGELTVEEYQERKKVLTETR